MAFANASGSTRAAAPPTRSVRSALARAFGSSRPFRNGLLARVDVAGLLAPEPAWFKQTGFAHYF